MGADAKLNIIKVKVADLKEAKENARVHDSHGIGQIKKSIEKFGFSDPIGIWGPDNIIVEGHGRFAAAKELGLEEVPCIRLDHLNDEERRSYMIMHNRTAELSLWDFKILASEAENAELYDFDIDFGLDDVDAEDFDDMFTLNDSDVPLCRTISMTLSPEQYEIAMAVIDYFQEQEAAGEELHTYGNENTKTNYFFEGVYQWAMQKNLL